MTNWFTDRARAWRPLVLVLIALSGASHAVAGVGFRAIRIHDH